MTMKSHTRLTSLVLAGTLIVAFSPEPRANAAPEIPKPTAPCVAADPRAAEVNDAARLVEILVSRGAQPGEAETVVAGLTVEDIEVLAQNPDMLQNAGDSNDVAAAVLLVLVILLLLGAAASAS